jgi:predicted nucleic acid-binding protein
VSGFVVDASVALKWCLPASDELFVKEAESLLASYLHGEIPFVVPDLFWIELANALWKAVWKGKIEAATAARGYTKIADLDIPTVASFDLVPLAMQIAIRYGPTAYDSLYVALARESRMDLMTADERLANALAPRFPVKWLGAVGF